MKNYAAGFAPVRGRAYPVKKQWKFADGIRRIEKERIARIDREITDLPSLEFRKERPKPVRMFVVNRDCPGRDLRACHRFVRRWLLERGRSECVHDVRESQRETELFRCR